MKGRKVFKVVVFNHFSVNLVIIFQDFPVNTVIFPKTPVL